MTFTHLAGNRIQAGGTSILKDIKLFYNFNDSSDTVKDVAHCGRGTVSDSNMDGANTGCTKGVEGKWGKCFEFDGTDDYVTIGGGTPGWNWMHYPNTKFTINMWVNFDDVSGNKKLISNCDNTNERGIEWTAESANGNMRIRDDTQTSVNIGTGIFQTGWHMYTMVVYTSGSNATFEAYKDGQCWEVAVDNTWTGSTGNATETMKIGRQAGADGQWMDGKIDETAIWSRCLSPAEIRQLYKVSLASSIFDFGMTTNVPDGTVVEELDTGREHVLANGGYVEVGKKPTNYYDQLHGYGSKGKHFWYDFAGYNDLNPDWGNTIWNIDGNGSGEVKPSTDKNGGFIFVTQGASAANSARISWSKSGSPNLTNYSFAGDNFVFICTARLVTNGNAAMYMGMTDNLLDEARSDIKWYCDAYNNKVKFKVDGHTAIDSGLDHNYLPENIFHNFKIETTTTHSYGTIDGVLAATTTDTPEGTNYSPYVIVRNSEGSGVIEGIVRYMECYEK